MRLTEKILVGIIIIALLLKFNLVSGGESLLLWATVLLSCIYFPLGFLFFSQIRLRNIFKKGAYIQASAGQIIFASLAGLSFSIICIGSLFKLFYFAGAGTMLITGSGMAIIILIIALILVTKKNTSAKPIVIRAVISGVIGITLLFTSGLSIVRLQYRNYPDYVRAYEDYVNDPRNPELERIKQREYYKVILSKEEFELYERSNNR